MQELLTFIAASPTAFHAVKESARILRDNGFEALKEEERWHLQPGGKYYVVRHDSALVAFSVGEEFVFNIVAAHTDSPSFRIKTAPVIKGTPDKLNVEPYGGAIFNTWFDRPLGIAGRIVTEREGVLSSRLFEAEDTVMIPNLAVHLNRGVNDGVKINAQTDMCPVVGEGGIDGLLRLPDGEKLRDYDLMLYNKEQGFVWGNGEYISSPRLDDLEGVFGGLMGITGADAKGINVLALLDSEEIGSSTYTGANSELLHDVLLRIARALNKTREETMIAYAGSLLLSLDNAHGHHPNHAELGDPTNPCRLNGGIVVKHHSSSYTSDGVSSAVIKAIFDRAGARYQDFYNRSDLRGGSTLGAISLAHVSINSVDIGLAQWAMHSAMESAGSKDLSDLVKGLKKFYGTLIIKRGNKVEFKE